MGLKPVQPIVKVTNECNLDCKRCYWRRTLQQTPVAPVKKSRGVDNILAIITKVAEYNRGFGCDATYYTLHGGDPTMVGLDALWDVVTTCKQTGGQVSLMTNLALPKLTNAWLNLFALVDSLGVSLNGDRKGNAGRVFVGGRPSFDRVVRNIRELQAAGLKNYGVCLTTGANNISRPKECVWFLHSLTPDMRIIPMDIPDYSPEFFYYFLVGTLEAVQEINNPNFIVRELDECARAMQGIDPNSCAYSGEFVCDGYITIMPNGDVYPCDSVIAAGEYPLGNILETTLDEILQGERWGRKVEDLRNKKGGMRFNCPAHQRRGGMDVYHEPWERFVTHLGQVMAGVGLEK